MDARVVHHGVAQPKLLGDLHMKRGNRHSLSPWPLESRGLSSTPRGFKVSKPALLAVGTVPVDEVATQDLLS